MHKSLIMPDCYLTFLAKVGGELRLKNMPKFLEP